MNKQEQRMARRSYYSRPTQIVLVVALIICFIMTLTFSDLSIAGILGLIVIAAVTIRGRMRNKVHVLRSVGRMTD